MAAGNGDIDSQPDKMQELYERARAARQQARVLAARHRAARHDLAETMQSIQAARKRAKQVRELGLAARSGRLAYSPYARLRAQLDTMPVIEQAKGILMAECGWPEDQAFDALRRASQRENVKLRELAAKIVAIAVDPAPAQLSPASRLRIVMPGTYPAGQSTTGTNGPPRSSPQPGHLRTPDPRSA